MHMDLQSRGTLKDNNLFSPFIFGGLKIQMYLNILPLCQCIIFDDQIWNETFLLHFNRIWVFLNKMLKCFYSLSMPSRVWNNQLEKTPNRSVLRHAEIQKQILYRTKFICNVFAEISIKLIYFHLFKKESIKTDDNFQYLDIYYHVYHRKLDCHYYVDW